MRRDPFAQHQTGVEPSSPLQYFTDREQFIRAFRQHVDATDQHEVQTLVFYGVGGIGKTTLMQKLCQDVEAMPETIPYARFNLENIADQTQAYRETLIRLRADLENNFKLDFPHFDLCLAVMLAREGGEPPPLLRVSPSLQTAFDAALELTPGLVRATTKLISFGVQTVMDKSDSVSRWVRKVGGTNAVAELTERLMEDDQVVQDELIRRFAQDLAQRLPQRSGYACRGVLFLDTYEALWTGRESGASAQARLLDEWVRLLAEYCLASGVLLVITGRESLNWADTDPDWQDLLDQQLLGGLSAIDAQLFLSRRDIGPPPSGETISLQKAIIRCANTSPSEIGPVNCHLLYLALCAEIVLNTRRVSGEDPSESTFSGVPSTQIASALATRFLKSLHNRNLELWVEALSLTPRFNEEVALTLDNSQQYHNGRAGWENLTRYSFVLAEPDGYYRMHRTMREALRARLSLENENRQHAWFQQFWEQRGDHVLVFYHRWNLDPAEALQAWVAEHDDAIAKLDVQRARVLLSYWSEIVLDSDDRANVTDELWAQTHAALGTAAWKTPAAPRNPALSRAADHFRSALSVYREDTTPESWAEANVGLALALMHLKSGDLPSYLREAMTCLQATLSVYTPQSHPEPWANVQNHLGIVWAKIPAENPEENAENQRRSIECFEATVQVWTEKTHPKIWARGQHNLGVCYMQLLDGDRRENLERAVAYFEAALRGRTRKEHPTGWALTKWNLGEVYSQLPDASADDLLKAIAYFGESLEIYTEEDFPDMWAEAQHSLGNTWRRMPGEDNLENLLRAAVCYEATLRVWSEEECPSEFAAVHYSLGLTLREIAGLTGIHSKPGPALPHFTLAARLFKQVGLAEEALEADRECEIEMRME